MADAVDVLLEQVREQIVNPQVEQIVGAPQRPTRVARTRQFTGAIRAQTPEEIAKALAGAEPARARRHAGCSGRIRLTTLAPSPSRRSSRTAGGTRRRRMTELAFRLDLLPEAELLAFLRGQRWFASKSREVVGLEILDLAELRTSEPLGAALVEVRYGAGPPDVYQLVVGARSERDFSGVEIASAGGLTSYEAFTDPLFGHELADRLRAGSDVVARGGTISFHGETGFPLGRSDTFETRVLGVEQSNSSLVLGEKLIVKAYRRLEEGVNPEVELLDFFARRGFENVPKLWGWWSYDSPRLHASLGVAQQFVPDAVDGWSLALDELVSAPAAFVARLRRLGAVIGGMHAVLASEPDDPAFAPEKASPDSLALLATAVGEESDRVLGTLPDGAAVVPIAGRAGEIREVLEGLTAAGSVGWLIRTHGDLHLGQLLWSQDDWLVIDFEGEPARPLPERRLKQSPLRDVAGMLRSFAYAVTVAEVVEQDLESRLRDAFLDGYLDAVRSSSSSLRRQYSSACSGSSSWRRPSTSCATSSQTARTGSRCPCAASSGCSRSRPETRPGTGAPGTQRPGAGRRTGRGWSRPARRDPGRPGDRRVPCLGAECPIGRRAWDAPRARRQRHFLRAAPRAHRRRLRLLARRPDTACRPMLALAARGPARPIAGARHVGVRVARRARRATARHARHLRAARGGVHHRGHLRCGVRAAAASSRPSASLPSS